MSEHWVDCLLESWGIKTQLFALIGEVDVNFKVETDYVEMLLKTFDLILVETVITRLTENINT